MKSTNKISEILVSAGYSKTDNRSYFTKSLNKVLSDGYISIDITPKGKVWLGEDGTMKGKSNLIVKGYGRKSMFYLDDVNSNTILRSVGRYIMIPEIAEKHLATISVEENEIEPCRKCNGTGYIPLFSYYCGGLCFDCYGSKYMVVKKQIII